MKKLLFLILLVVLGFGAYQFYYQRELNFRPSDSETKVRLLIKPGTSLSEITAELADKNLIGSTWAFLRYTKQTGFDREIEAGIFYLSTNLTIPELVDELKNGKSSELRITLKEGWTNADIDKYLTEKELIQPGDFLACVQDCDFSDFSFLPEDKNLREGYFWPDTYDVDESNFSVEAFAKRLLETFQLKTADLLANKDDIFDTIIMASIIEKESNAGQERYIISGILWKRIENNWFLGVDAVNRYTLNKPSDPLTVDDLDDDSSWNTRKHLGLPPGAICNPGLSSIEAAVRPQDSEYWYYLHGRDGQVRYGESEAEHNRNKAKYL